MIEQLRDIRGLDPIPWWPPAPGWWLLGGAVLFMVALVIVYGRRRRARRSDWKPEARRLLQNLHRQAGELEGHALAGQLSELLRRIAMVRFGRRACAGLMQEKWLAWLEAHDPNGFEWQARGCALIEWPYAPKTAPVNGESLEVLIEAAEAWVDADRPPRRKHRGKDVATTGQALPSVRSGGLRRHLLTGGRLGC